MEPIIIKLIMLFTTMSGVQYTVIDPNFTTLADCEVVKEALIQELTVSTDVQTFGVLCVEIPSGT